MRFSKFAATALAGVALVGFLPATANADAVSDFYEGKAVSIYVGVSPGGTWLFAYILFHRIVHVVWPQSFIGDLFPGLRAINAVSFF
jgi:hypothetical protein